MLMRSVIICHSVVPAALIMLQEVKYFLESGSQKRIFKSYTKMKTIWVRHNNFTDILSFTLVIYLAIHYYLILIFLVNMNELPPYSPIRPPHGGAYHSLNITNVDKVNRNNWHLK